MSRVYLVAARDEIARRRPLLPKGSVIEAWPDREVAGLFWMGETSKTLLESVGPPIPAQQSLPLDSVAVYYGPRLADLESLPTEESLKSRVLSGHGFAAAWITLNRLGERGAHEPTGPDDPIFHLRRLGGGSGHVWRLFRDRTDAREFMAEHDGRGSEGHEWAQALEVETFAEFLKKYAAR